MSTQLNVKRNLFSEHNRAAPKYTQWAAVTLVKIFYRIKTKKIMDQHLPQSVQENCWKNDPRAPAKQLAGLTREQKLVFQDRLKEQNSLLHLLKVKAKHRIDTPN